MALPFSTFLNRLYLDWEQGQHLSIVGTTGKGKTFLAHDLLGRRRYVSAFIAKDNDKTLDERYEDYRRIRSWQEKTYADTKLLIWPKHTDLENFSEQRVIFLRTLNGIYKSKEWCAYFDDMFFLSHTLHMKGIFQLMYTQARSENVTLVASINRPAWIPREVLVNSTYLIVFKCNGETDIPLLAKAAGTSQKTLEKLNGELEERQFIFIKHGENAEIVERAA